MLFCFSSVGVVARRISMERLGTDTGAGLSRGRGLPLRDRPRPKTTVEPLRSGSVPTVTPVPAWP